ncbi:MAG: TolC family protein [Prevotellaceae bacterium]|jgi:outer membrane protein TolC|nr:TolC family protein [Prevotellaceae bacterium]
MTALLTAGQVQAQETTQETLTLTLDKALEIALADNPTMKVADEQIALKKIADKETWQNLLPQVDVNGSWQYTITAASISLGDQTFKMGRDASNTAAAAITVGLPLFAPSVYKAMAMTKTDIELAVEQSRASQQDLVNQVTKAYYLLMLSQDSYRVMQETYALSEENFNNVNAMYQQGSVSEYDKLTAEVQLRSVKPSVVSASNAVTLAKLQLKVLMGVTANVDIKIDDSLANYETMLFANQLNDWDEGLADNSSLRQMDLNRKLLTQNVKALRANFLPTFNTQFSFQYQSMNNHNWDVFSKFKFSPSSSLAFSLTIPIFHASNFTKLKSAHTQIRQLDYSRADTERKLNMQAVSYRNNMQASSEQVASNKENIVQAGKAVDIATTRYKAGSGTVLELNNSQVALTQAELTYNQSIYDYLTNKADLDMVLGRDYVAKEEVK